MWLKGTARRAWLGIASACRPTFQCLVDSSVQAVLVPDIETGRTLLWGRGAATAVVIRLAHEGSVRHAWLTARSNGTGVARTPWGAG